MPRFSLPRALLPGLAALLIALAPAAQVTPKVGGPKDHPEPKVRGVDVTFLVNGGFFLESGEYSVLIDAFVRESVGVYPALPDEVYKELAYARPPYDGMAVILVSHAHPDHVQMRGLEKYMLNNPKGVLLTSHEMVRAFKADAESFEPLRNRITVVPLVKGSLQTVINEEMSVSFLELQHMGRTNEERVVNLGHLIELGGVKILHVGDAEPSLETFAPYDLDSLGIDVAIVPYWFFATPAGMQVLQEEIRARTVIACHVPPKDWEHFDEVRRAKFPDVVLFKEPLEKRSFMPREPVEPAGSGGGGKTEEPGKGGG